MFTNLQQKYQYFGRTFWLVAFASFIDQIGNFILMPFIALYITDKFPGFGMTQVGIMFSIVGIGNLVGGTLGGSLADKFGRKPMILFGLVVSGTFSLAIIFIENVTYLYILLLGMGVLGSVGGPARSALMADVLTPDKRTEGFAVLRITMNLAATIGPALGSFLIAYNFNLIFIIDAISSAITGILFFLLIPETKPETSNVQIEQASSSVASKEIPVSEELAKKGYKHILRDSPFMLFVVISSLMALVYIQMQGTLSVYLRDNHGFTAEYFGYLIAMNAFLVVVFQYFVTRKIKHLPPLLMMAAGNLLYGIGFAMYGFVAAVPMFFVAMGIITLGEMVVTPFSQSIVANFAPEDMRGRYMAVQQWSGLAPTLFGVLGAGILMDNGNPIMVWILAGILSAIAALGFSLLHKMVKSNETEKEMEIASEQHDDLGMENSWDDQETPQDKIDADSISETIQDTLSVSVSKV